MLKHLLFWVFILQVSISSSQSRSFNWNNWVEKFNGKGGVTVGITNYITDTNLLFSKSGTGFLIGLTSSAEFNERAGLLLSLSYNRHSSKFVGREDQLAPQEDISFNLDQIAFTPLFNYNIVLLDDYKFGVFAGPSFNFLYDWRLADDSKEEFVLEPLLTSPADLRFDTENEDISFNLYASVGISAQYADSILLQLKYERSITDPYRRAPVFSNFLEIEGTDTILSFSTTYFF